MARALQESGQGVIVFVADRVELVIVAAGAGDRQAEERLAKDVDLVVDPVDLVLAGVDGRMRPLARGTRNRCRGSIRSKPSVGCRRGSASRSPAICSTTKWS